MPVPSTCKVLIASLSIFFLFYSYGFSQRAYLLTDTSVVHRLDGHVQFFIDSTDRLSIGEVASPAFQSRFVSSTGDLTFGLLTSSIWLKVKTQTGSLQSKWYLEIPAPFLEYVDFYQLRNGNDAWHRSTSGYYVKHSEREFSHTGHILPLEFKRDSLSTVYVRIAGVSPKTFPVHVLEKRKLDAKTRLEDLGYGIFFGILIVMFFYNVFIYLIARHQSYLFYFCTLIFTFLIFSAISGYGGKFLWPEKPVLNFYAGKLSLDFLVIFISLFTISFLQVKKFSKVMYYLLASLIPLSVVALLLVATGTFSFAGNNLISVATLVFIASGIVVRAKGNKTAIYFIAAWTVYFAGGLLVTLRNIGIFDYNFWTTHFVEIGAVLQTAIIVFALGDQYRRYKKEKDEAQLLALRIQQEATSRLEVKVNERTEALSKANEHLQHTLETNRRQTEIIEEKNAELDSFFYRISHDLKGPLSSSLGLIMLAKLEVKDKHALDLIERQHIQLERLRNIIEGLVKLTKLKDIYLETERIDFDKMIDECIMSFNTLPKFGDITFKKEIQPGIEFYSEWTLLNAIFQNLIENAIKYAGDQSQFVRIMVGFDEQGLIIEVEDNGVGIPLEDQPRIFEIFYRVSQNQNGSGLGLYILKRSVDRLKGSIEVKSQAGSGSTFTVRLPSRKEIVENVELTAT